VEINGHLASLANFARFLIPQIFSSFTRALYIDVDTIFQVGVRGYLL
jgi:lipopolysaccharide biosynthesis glycosyltransferase